MMNISKQASQPFCNVNNFSYLMKVRISIYLSISVFSYLSMRKPLSQSPVTCILPRYHITVGFT